MFVKTAQRLGFAPAEVGEIGAFRERGHRPCTYVLAMLECQVGDLDRRINELQDLRAELAALQAQADRFPPYDNTSYRTVIDHATAMSTPAGQAQWGRLTRGRPEFVGGAIMFVLPR